MKLKNFFNFTTQKLLVIEDYRIGGISRFFQLLVILFIIYDLLTKQLYFKTEIPFGYTTVWAESNNLYNIQTNSNLNKPSFCNNSNYNYIYSLPYWDYRNNSCINLHYSEMYQKGENEMFYMSYFTENNIILGDCNIIQNKTCMINDKLDGNCFCQNMKKRICGSYGRKKDMQFIPECSYRTMYFVWVHQYQQRLIFYQTMSRV